MIETRHTVQAGHIHFFGRTAQGKSITQPKDADLLPFFALQVNVEVAVQRIGPATQIIGAFSFLRKYETIADLQLLVQAVHA